MTMLVVRLPMDRSMWILVAFSGAAFILGMVCCLLIVWIVTC